MKVKLWSLGVDTQQARRYSKLPKSRNPQEEDFVWIPISQIEHTTRHLAEPGEWPVHIVTVSDWFGEKAGL